MLANESMRVPSLTYEEVFSDYVFEFLQALNYRDGFDIQNGDRLEFSIIGRNRPDKINPIIKAAHPGDVNDIIEIYKDIYENSYPYKEMEDPEGVLTMVESENVEFFVFQDIYGENIGCFTLVLDFEDKMGYTRGLNIRKKYLGKVDVLKAFMGCFLSACMKYDGQILRWYGESRTAHTSSQYVMRLCGFRPVGFFPNKDIFYHKVESDILIISYDEKALRAYRSKEMPIILPEVKLLYEYSDRMYRLGKYEMRDPTINLDFEKIDILTPKLTQEITSDKYGYQEITLSFEDSDSYFKFLYTPQVQNFEKTKYKVNDLEELYAFTQEFKKTTEIYNVRYFEAYISAYNVEHQKIFLELGMIPRGYVPSWKYNHKTNTFDDYILFNFNKGNIDEHIQLLDEGKELIRDLGYAI